MTAPSETKRKQPPLGVTERAVLARIAKGDRCFGGHREIMALHKLAGRGLVEVDVRVSDVERRRAYNFGRNRRYDRTQEAGALVRAPRIEAAVERHGLATVLRSIEHSGREAEPEPEPRIPTPFG